MLPVAAPTPAARKQHAVPKKVQNVVVRFSLYTNTYKQALSVTKQLKVNYFPALLGSSLFEHGMGVRTVRVMKGAHFESTSGDDKSGWDDDDYADYKGLLTSAEGKKMKALLSAQRRTEPVVRDATDTTAALKTVGSSALEFLFLAVVLLVSAVSGVFCSSEGVRPEPIAPVPVPVEPGETKSLLAPAAQALPVDLA
jgi:hypothetical protein